MLILAQIRSLQREIKNPLNLTSHVWVEYSCFDVSEKFIAIAGFAGGVYLYKRDPCVFCQLIPYTDGIINKVSISPNEKWIVYTTTESLFRLVLIAPDPDKTPYVDLIETKMKLSVSVSALVWGSDSSKIFIGDSLGRVQVFTIKVINRTISSTLKVILELDSPIVQMDNFDEYLLISTLNQTFISNLRTEQYNQVGLRSHSGLLGICFLKSHNSKEEPKGYCARPGSKLWEINVKGQVERTHLFKESLTVSPTKVYNVSEAFDKRNIKMDGFKKIPHSNSPKSISFPKLLPMGDSQLFTFAENSFYILNPNDSTVILWNNEFLIKDAKAINNNIYIFRNDEVIELKLLTVPEFVVEIYNNKKYELCERMCSYFADEIMLPTTDFKYLNLLVDLDEKCTLSAASSYLIKKIIFENDIQNWNSHVLSSKGLRTPFPLNRLLKKRPRIDIENQCFASYNCIETQEFENKFLVYFNHVENQNVQENNSVPQNSNNTETTLSSHNASTSVDQLSGFHPKTAHELHNLRRIMKKMFLTRNISNDNPLTFGDEIVNILNEYSISELFHVIIRLGKYVIDKGITIDDANTKCSMLFLYYLTSNLHLFDESICRKYLCVFLIIAEAGRGISCCCGYPVPRRNPKPLFYDISEKLLIYLLNANELKYIMELCRYVPYMWQMLMDLITMKDNYLRDLINISLQTSYKPGFQKCLEFITISEWKYVIKAKLKIDKGLCLDCGKDFSNKKTSDIDETQKITWAYLGKSMVDSIGGTNAIKLLTDPGIEIPVATFSVEFYQYCILNSQLNIVTSDDLDVSKMECIDATNENQVGLQNTIDDEDNIIRPGYVPKRIYRYKCQNYCICKKIPNFEDDDDISEERENDNNVCNKSEVDEERLGVEEGKFKSIDESDVHNNYNGDIKFIIPNHNHFANSLRKFDSREPYYKQNRKRERDNTDDEHRPFKTQNTSEITKCNTGVLYVTQSLSMMNEMSDNDEQDEFEEMDDYEEEDDYEETNDNDKADDSDKRDDDEDDSDNEDNNDDEDDNDDGDSDNEEEDENDEDENIEDDKKDGNDDTGNEDEKCKADNSSTENNKSDANDSDEREQSDSGDEDDSKSESDEEESDNSIAESDDSNSDNGSDTNDESLNKKEGNTENNNTSKNSKNYHVANRPSVIVFNHTRFYNMLKKIHTEAPNFGKEIESGDKLDSNCKSACRYHCPQISKNEAYKNDNRETNSSENSSNVVVLSDIEDKDRVDVMVHTDRSNSNHSRFYNLLSKLELEGLIPDERPSYNFLLKVKNYEFY